ncbi:quinone-dependent dihydroorotate dehydrogenase [bacterium]|nr:MAG: quinone-dependent dihydroorotate dehydrogenase [bacterium]
MSLWWRAARRALFALEAERAHELGLGVLETLQSLPVLRRLLEPVCDPILRVEPWPGVVFPNPLGLAAGFDKNGRAYEALAALGFGFVEVGTVTPLPQPGNPRPRLFRLPLDRALINRLGFNNEGAEAVAARLRAPRRAALGINVGKGIATPLERAVDDYVQAWERLAPLADYTVVNISSPNTPGLRSLQARGELERLVEALCEARARAPRRPPLLLKIAPELDENGLADVAEIVRRYGVDGVVATNTTTGREGLRTPREFVERCGNGGLSGAPLRSRSLKVLQLLRALLPRPVVLVGVGGVSTFEDFWERLEAGADLVQAYTGFIYGGPQWPRQMLRRLAARLREKGTSTGALLRGGFQ